MARVEQQVARRQSHIATELMATRWGRPRPLALDPVLVPYGTPCGRLGAPGIGRGPGPRQ